MTDFPNFRRPDESLVPSFPFGSSPFSSRYNGLSPLPFLTFRDPYLYITKSARKISFSLSPPFMFRTRWTHDRESVSLARQIHSFRWFVRSRLEPSVSVQKVTFPTSLPTTSFPQPHSCTPGRVSGCSVRHHRFFFPDTPEFLPFSPHDCRSTFPTLLTSGRRLPRTVALSVPRTCRSCEGMIF